jgi:hypothetical protein
LSNYDLKAVALFGRGSETVLQAHFLSFFFFFFFFFAATVNDDNWNAVLFYSRTWIG